MVLQLILKTRPFQTQKTRCPTSSSSKNTPLVGDQGGLALPPPLLLPPLQSHLPADHAGRQEHQPGREEHQAKVGDGGSMRVEAVSHSGDHDASDEDHHAKGDGAAVAGELGPPRGCGQLHFID